ncbi:type II toxin-antitoxin system Phd/YefM family antitoxin [soil metagenome]|jgi:prevent-host-death family protein|nr:type II toxin-antitoxin system Phd/YefM family antitoxin [Gemmatimonadota bacterium]
MRIPRLSQDIRPLSEFRSNAAAFVQHVRSTRRPLVLTQHGRSAAVLLDIAEYERLLEQLEVLQEVQTAEQQLAEGQGIEHNDAKEQILARLRR